MGAVLDHRTGLLNDHSSEQPCRIGSAAGDLKGPSVLERDARAALGLDEPTRPNDRHAESFGCFAYSDEESSNADSDASSTHSYSTSNTSYSGEFVVADSLADSLHAQDQAAWHSAGSAASGAARRDDEADGHAPSAARNQTRLDYPSATDVSFLLAGLKSEAESLSSVPSLTKGCSTQTTPCERGSQPQPDNKLALALAPGTSRCRRRSVGNGCAPPPRLRRDTDSADLFVNLLIAFACRLITAIWPLAATPPMMSDCFNGAGVLPLHTFIYETLRRSKTSYSTLQIALYYLILLKPTLPRLACAKPQTGASAGSPSSKEDQSCRAMQCGRRMFLCALILASKYIQDRNYSTRAWSKISGLRIPEINENERQYLRLINYSLHIKQATFENWSKVVLLLSRISKMQPPSFDLVHHQRAGQQQQQQQQLGTDSLYTKEWWNRLCNSLDSSTFHDSAKTDAFIIEHIPVEQIERAMHMTPTPPSAGGQGGASDLTFSEPSSSRMVAASAVSTPVQLAACSPAHSLDVPTRPHPRKLETPNSTPRGPEITHPCVVPQPQLGGTRTPRHAASVDALRNVCMRKQACNASIDRCPPPQTPQPAVAAAAAASDPRTTSTLPGPSPPTTPCRQQPAALLSMSQYRSRSNSISSNSSTSTVMSPLRDLATSNLSQQSLLTPTSVEGDTLSGAESGIGGGQHRPLRRKRASGNLGPVARQDKDQDEGYHSAEDPRQLSTLTPPGQSELENCVAGALVAMSVGNGQDSITPKALPLRSQDSTPKASAYLPRKRASSKASDALADSTRRLLCADSRLKEVGVQSAQATTTTTTTTTPEATNVFPAEKQVQHPHRAWAQVKQPVWNAHPCKRIAMDGTAQRATQMTAPELAANWLPADIEAQ